MKLSFSLLMCLIAFCCLSQNYTHSFVFLSSNPSRSEMKKEKVDSLQQLHLENIQSMAKNGRLSIAGPFEGGGEIFPWQPRHGGVCLVDTSVQMVPYFFIRYNTNITKFNVRNMSELFQQHDKYIDQIVKTGNVVSDGVFANSDGGTLVVKGSLDTEVVMNDPTVVNGIIEPTIKRVWLGKGSFCEK